jgi:hypothetical protein
MYTKYIFLYNVYCVVYSICLALIVIHISYYGVFPITLSYIKSAAV